MVYFYIHSIYSCGGLYDNLAFTPIKANHWLTEVQCWLQPLGTVSVWVVKMKAGLFLDWSVRDGPNESV